jgi:GNAT superfamily N-acetyltransferase
MLPTRTLWRFSRRAPTTETERRMRMTARYTISAARPHDLTQLPAIELAASRLFAGMAPESILNMTTSQDALKQAQLDGHLWVVLANETPVGFALVEIVERDAVHLEEIDVHPDHGRRGLGTRLVMHVCRWAAAAGFQSVTLNTDRDVPWNAPFYARLGFKVVPHEELSPALRAVFENETRRGLDPSRRVVMRRPSTTL